MRSKNKLYIKTDRIRKKAWMMGVWAGAGLGFSFPVALLWMTNRVPDTFHVSIALVVAGCSTFIALSFILGIGMDDAREDVAELWKVMVEIRKD